MVRKVIYWDYDRFSFIFDWLILIFIFKFYIKFKYERDLYSFYGYEVLKFENCE